MRERSFTCHIPSYIYTFYRKKREKKEGEMREEREKREEEERREKGKGGGRRRKREEKGRRKGREEDKGRGQDGGRGSSGIALAASRPCGDIFGQLSFVSNWDPTILLSFEDSLTEYVHGHRRTIFPSTTSLRTLPDQTAPRHPQKNALHRLTDALLAYNGIPSNQTMKAAQQRYVESGLGPEVEWGYHRETQGSPVKLTRTRSASLTS